MAYKIYLAVNPHGGMEKGLGILDLVRPVFHDKGVELTILETEYPGHAQEMINTMDFEDIDGFCAIGGDGTFHEVVNGLLTRKDKKQVPIGLIPGGTGNSFMHTVECLDPVEAAKRIVSGSTIPVDVAEVKTGKGLIYSINIIGWGLVTDIGITAENYRWMGESRYTLVSMLEIFRLKQRSAKLIINETEEINDFTFILALNTKHTGKGMYAAPKAKLDDGLIDLIIVREKGKIKLLNLLPKIFDGTHIESNIVEYSQVSRFSLFPDEESPLNIDGEITGKTPIEVKMIPGCFQFLN